MKVISGWQWRGKILFWCARHCSSIVYCKDETTAFRVTGFVETSWNWTFRWLRVKWNPYVYFIPMFNQAYGCGQFWFVGGIRLIVYFGDTCAVFVATGRNESDGAQSIRVNIWDTGMLHVVRGDDVNWKWFIISRYKGQMYALGVRSTLTLWR